MLNDPSSGRIFAWKLAAVAFCLCLLLGCAKTNERFWGPAPAAPPVPPSHQFVTVADPDSVSCVTWTGYYYDSTSFPADYTDALRKMISEHFMRCQDETKTDEAYRQMNVAAALVYEYCVTHPNDFCEPAKVESRARNREWERLDNHLRGVVTYSCPDGWLLRNETCWAYRTAQQLAAEGSWRSKMQCSPALQAGADLCSQPANKDQ